MRGSMRGFLAVGCVLAGLCFAAHQFRTADASTPKRPAGEECTLDLSVRSLRIGGTEKEPGFVLSTNGSNCLKINRPGSDHGVTLMLDDDGGYIWLQGKNEGPIVAIYERHDQGVVGVYSPLAGGRKRVAVDACLAADRNGGSVQLLDKCSAIHQLTADKVDPPKCDK